MIKAQKPILNDVKVIRCQSKETKYLLCHDK